MEIWWDKSGKEEFYGAKKRIRILDVDVDNKVVSKLIKRKKQTN